MAKILLVSNIIENDKISGVALTGSTKAGIEVAKKAGECLKKTVLELGGNDPYLILDDADLDNAVKACIEGRLLNTGQSCISAKRLIITKNNIMTGIWFDTCLRLKDTLQTMLDVFGNRKIFIFTR